jgi:glutamate racemase
MPLTSSSADSGLRASQAAALRTAASGPVAGDPGRDGRGPVLCLDSGIGGLPYLELARQSLPGESFAYLADTAQFPYGQKSPARVRAAIMEAARRGIEALRPRAVVVACNTASVVALQSLRERYAVPFVGTVPAIKPAALATRSGRVGLLATRRTVHTRYLKGMIRSFAARCRVVLVPAPGVVDFVERRWFEASPAERRAIAVRAAATMRRRGVDVVVLACTHFLHLEAELRAVLGDGIRLIDSRDGVVRQLGRVLAALSAAGPPETAAAAATAEAGARHGGPARLFVTRCDGVEPRYRRFCDERGIDFAGEIP